MTATHSPFPWARNTRNPYSDWADADGMSVYFRPENETGMFSERAKANATLVEAIPEMMAALHAVADMDNRVVRTGGACRLCDALQPMMGPEVHETDCPMPMVRAAIEKAPGR